MTELLNRALLDLAPQDPRAYVELAKDTEGCILLTTSEPDFGISDVVKTNTTRALNMGLTHYMEDGNGETSLRIAATRFEERSMGLKYEANEIIMTAGGTEALYIALQGILNPGDEVIIPVPAIDLYETNVKLAGATPVFLDTTGDKFQITAEKLAAVITDKTKAIILNSPNNPTGTILTKESLQVVHDAVAGKPIFVICDDVYNRVVYDGVCPSFAALHADLKPQILVVQSFSNSYAMAGYRLGYLLGDAPIIEKLSTLHKTAVQSIPNFHQNPAIEALHSDIMGMVWAYDSRRKLVCEKLDALGLEYVAPEGGFYVFPSVKKFGVDDKELCTRLIKEAKVAVLPGSCFGADGYIRISYSAPVGNLKAGLIRLENFLKSL